MKPQEPLYQLDPNLNAEAYRNLIPAEQLPFGDKQLEVILVHKDGSLVLGASNMVDRYWYGTVWLYNDLDNLDRNHYSAATRTETGVCVATYLEKYDKFVIGEDSGIIQIFDINVSVETKGKELQCMGYSYQHDDSLTSMSTFNDNAHIVTAGMDTSIKVWDTVEMVATSSFYSAQLDTITSVQVQIGSNAVFASTSMDSEALLWDIRKAKPALGLWKKDGCGLTATSWKCDDKNIIAVGGIDGSISALDIRKISAESLHESVQFSRRVHKILFNPDHPNQVAACCDDTEVKVLDVSKDCSSIFYNNEHTDFVRSLAWHKNDLITCSWDNKILKHSVASELSA